MIIVKKVDLEKLLIDICEQNAPDITGNDYFVFGTIDKKDWRIIRNTKISPNEAIRLSYPFKDIWKIKTNPVADFLKMTEKA